MAKRVYSESVKKFLLEHKIESGVGIAGTLIGGIFLYLSMIGAIDVLGYSGDMRCAGTIEDPCYAYINFTANEDIFIYPIDYDPWGRNTPFEFNPNVKSWKLQRSWGKSWRNIPLDKSCTGTWCGLSNKDDKRKFSVAFREGKTYQIRIVAYKNNPSDTIKWGAFDEIDPIWLPVEKDKDIYNIQICTTSYWNTSKNIYIDCVKDYIITEAYDCLDEKDNTTCQFKEVVKYYNSTCFDRTELTQHSEIVCEDTGQVNVSGNIVSYKDSFCLYHKSLDEIHCSLCKDSHGGGTGADCKDGRGICSSGQVDCQIMKINEDKSIKIIKESRSKLEVI